VAAFRADVSQLRRAAAALRREADGKALRQDLLASMRAAGEPAVAEMRSRIMSMPTAGSATRRSGRRQVSLRAKLASRVMVKAATGGRWAGIRIWIAKRIAMPRGFVNAPWTLNRPTPWAHKLWGRSDTAVQVSRAPGWFDEPARMHHDDGRKAALQSLQAMLDRLGR
jgi:hypothetical protein